jgi:hypothetical protein
MVKLEEIMGDIGDARIDLLAGLILGSPTGDAYDMEREDAQALAHYLINRGYSQQAGDPNLASRVDRLERWAQGGVVNW